MTRLASLYQARFPDRPILDDSQIIGLFCPAFYDSPEEARSLLVLLEQAFGIPMGLLRPEDSMQSVLTPSYRQTPWSWAQGITRAGDGELWLLEQLIPRIVSRGHNPDDVTIETVGELARAWCGVPRLKPTGPSSDS
jgi:hypothetical protein